MSFPLSELMRKVANLVRVGTVETVDYPKAVARVRFGDIVTHWLPWTVERAGNDRTWWAPEPGEQVVVVSPDGDLSQGVISGSLYRAAHSAPAESVDVARVVYSDGCVIEYDRAAHKLTANVPGDVDVTASGNVEVTAGEKIEATAPRITLNGVIFLNGPVTQGGGSNGGDARLNGKLHVAQDVTTDADVTAGVSLNNHTHGCPDGGTGSPN